MDLTGDDKPPLFFLIFLGFFALIFVLIFLRIGYVILRGLIHWNRNNNAPLTTVPAVIVGRRTQVSGGGGDSSASTYYHVTFEVQGGERMELGLPGREYGLLVEGDRGRLSYQGTRYKGFDRTPQDR